jgi:predicted  nucleic acid-binding Zn-ribbon protein
MGVPRGKVILPIAEGDKHMDEKSAYRQKLEARLDQWQAEIDGLKGKAAEAGADARIEYEKQVEALRAQQDKARQKLKELDAASGEAWKDLKAGIEKAWDDLGSAVKAATGRFG